MKKIMLTQGRHAVVDDVDYEKLSKYKWHFSGGYAKRGLWFDGKQHIVRMHHFILPIKSGLMVDHINRDGLDNRRKNLRLVTKSQNMMNRGKQKNNKSGFMGVSFRKKFGDWRAYIKKDKRQIHLGTFSDIKDAARAYNRGAILHHGKFAFLNKI